MRQVPQRVRWLSHRGYYHTSGRYKPPLWHHKKASNQSWHSQTNKYFTQSCTSISCGPWLQADGPNLSLKWIPPHTHIQYILLVTWWKHWMFDPNLKVSNLPRSIYFHTTHFWQQEKWFSSATKKLQVEHFLTSHSSAVAEWRDIEGWVCGGKGLQERVLEVIWQCQTAHSDSWQPSPASSCLLRRAQWVR